MITFGIIGSYGKMGKSLLSCIENDKSLALAWDLGSKNSKRHNLAKPSAIIDFSAPEALFENLKLAMSLNCPIIIGTTGLSADNHKLIEKASNAIPALWASNFSLGMTLMGYVLKAIAPLAAKTFKAQIKEIHHIHKKDKPSGSALTLEQLLKEANAAPAPIDSLREGETIGVHEVTFTSSSETLRITHEALNRDVFAKGALEAARLLSEKPSGLYSLENLLLGP